MTTHEMRVKLSDLVAHAVDEGYFTDSIFESEDFSRGSPEQAEDFFTEVLEFFVPYIVANPPKLVDGEVVWKVNHDVLSWAEIFGRLVESFQWKRWAQEDKKNVGR
jgi:hypothetical protein